MTSRRSNSTNNNYEVLELLRKIEKNLKLGNLNQALSEILTLDSLLNLKDPVGINAFPETEKLLKDIGSRPAVIELIKKRKIFTVPSDKKKSRENERLEILLGIKSTPPCKCVVKY